MSKVLGLKPHFSQAGKRSAISNFWVRISSGGVGVFHMNRWGAKKFAMSLETQGNKTFGWDVPAFCLDIQRAPFRQGCDGEKTIKIKICVFEEGHWGREENHPKTRFFIGNAMTIKL